jgi:hypothetical protein
MMAKATGTPSRQDVPGRWGPVVGRVAAELARLAGRHAA